MVDQTAGAIVFGRARVPQIGERIRVLRYRYGGGAGRQRGRRRRSPRCRGIGGVKVTNPLPAVGGADAVSLVEALDRSRPRCTAATAPSSADDFRELALQVHGRGPGRDAAVVHPDTPLTQRRRGGQRGRVPRRGHARPPTPRCPTSALLRRVAAYLDPRRLVTTELYVIPPTYRPISVSVGVQVRAGYQVDARAALGRADPAPVPRAAARRSGRTARAGRWAAPCAVPSWRPWRCRSTASSSSRDCCWRASAAAARTTVELVTLHALGGAPDRRRHRGGRRPAARADPGRAPATRPDRRTRCSCHFPRTCADGRLTAASAMIADLDQWARCAHDGTALVPDGGVELTWDDVDDTGATRGRRVPGGLAFDRWMRSYRSRPAAGVVEVAGWPDGEPVPPVPPGTLRRPLGLAVDRQQRLYVAETGGVAVVDVRAQRPAAPGVPVPAVPLDVAPHDGGVVVLVDGPAGVARDRLRPGAARPRSRVDPPVGRGPLVARRGDGGAARAVVPARRRVRVCRGTGRDRARRGRRRERPRRGRRAAGGVPRPGTVAAPVPARGCDRHRAGAARRAVVRRRCRRHRPRRADRVHRRGGGRLDVGLCGPARRRRHRR